MGRIRIRYASMANEVEADSLVRGWASIAKFVSLTVTEAKRAAKRSKDTLPVHRCAKGVFARQHELRAWWYVRGGRIVGWKTIADRIGVTELTARTLAKREHDPLPVHREEGRYFAHKWELQDWVSGESLNAMPMAMQVLFALVVWARKAEGGALIATRTREQIAADLGCAPRSVTSALRELSAGPFVRRLGPCSYEVRESAFSAVRDERRRHCLE